MSTSDDIRPELGLRQIINVSGTMTALGASIVVPEAIEAIRRSLPQFFDMGALHKRASAVIAELTGAEAGFVTASCAAGITLSVAGAMTRDDLYAIEQLPDTNGLKNEVVGLAGHMVSFGSSIAQLVRITGAKMKVVGEATSSHAYQLAGAINENTAAGLYVVSHHVVDYAQIPLKTFAKVCHDKGVPVIVDAASEYDLQLFLDQGADIVVYSGHKFLGGPTTGIVAGRKDLVRATYLQNRGIGRGMKVGKESIVGVMAALEAWKTRDHAGIRAREQAALDTWMAALADRPGVTATIVPDPTDNPLDRLKLSIDPEAAHITAWDLAIRLASGDEPVIVRDHEVEHGHFFLDPCNLHPEQEHIVARRLGEELDRALQSNEIIATPFDELLLKREAGITNWPD
jgi:D-glucosaminate-6-phosphate ammonia-lyase